MKPQPASSHIQWLYLAVLGSLALFGAFVWWSIHSQRKTAWENARTESRNSVLPMAEIVGRNFHEQLTNIPASQPSGEPVPTDSFTLKAWKDAETVRQLAEKWLTDPHPRAERWVDSDTPIFLRRVGDNLEYYILITKDFAGYEDIPPWQHIYVSVGGPMTGKLVLASAAVFIPRFEPDDAWIPLEDRYQPFADDRLWLNILAVPKELEAPVRRQQHWALGLFGIAIFTCGIALASIHRTLRRQRQLNEMKSQFVASASHELRAPVASIRLMADALQSQEIAPEMVTEFHRQIAREGSRLSTLIGNVLDLSRIEQGRKIWKMELSDLAAMAADTIRLMEPLAREKNITLESELSPVDATADAAAIQQALVNLLDNAIKFSPAGTTIITKLATCDDNHNWQLSIHDRGPGIPKVERSRIFERFYRPTDELRRDTQGTGIGLSLVKAAAEAHGGRVMVNTAPGGGNIFRMIVPITPVSP